MGRTGFCGRGSLARWGPNHTLDTIITRCGDWHSSPISILRWALTHTMDFVKKDGKKVLEVLLLYNFADKPLLPSDFVPPALWQSPALMEYIYGAVAQAPVQM